MDDLKPTIEGEALRPTSTPDASLAPDTKFWDEVVAPADDIVVPEVIEALVEFVGETALLREEGWPS